MSAYLNSLREEGTREDLLAEVVRQKERADKAEARATHYEKCWIKVADGPTKVQTELRVEAEIAAEIQKARAERAEAERDRLRERLRSIGQAARMQSVNNGADANHLRGAMQALADSAGETLGEWIDVPPRPSALLDANPIPPE